MNKNKIIELIEENGILVIGMPIWDTEKDQNDTINSVADFALKMYNLGLNKGKNMSNKNEDVVSELENKYNSIKELVHEFNKLAQNNKLSTRVGCVINENDKDNEDEEYDWDENGKDRDG